MANAINEPTTNPINDVNSNSFMLVFFIIPTNIPINSREGIIIAVSPVSNEQASIISIVKGIVFPFMMFLAFIVSFNPKKRFDKYGVLLVYSSGVPSIALIFAGKYSSTIYSRPYFEKDCCSAFLPSLSIFLISVCQKSPR